MTKAVAKTEQQQKFDTLRLTLSQMQSQIVKALPRHIPAESWMRTVLTLVQKNPNLLECTKESFLGALMESAQRGLVVGHEVHIIPFRNNKRQCTEAQVVYDYKGYIKLMINSGVASAVKADVVRVGDEFDDTGEKIHHVKNYDLGETRTMGDVEYVVPKKLRPIWCVYCEILGKDGHYQHRTLTMDEIERARAASKKPEGIWKDHPIEMMKKTAVRRIAKYVPQSPELLRATELDDLDLEDRSQGLASIVDTTYVPEFETSSATTISQINDEAGKENEVEKKKRMIDKILKQSTTMQGVGFKMDEIFKVMKIKEFKDLNAFDFDKLSAILDVMVEHST